MKGKNRKRNQNPNEPKEVKKVNSRQFVDVIVFEWNFFNVVYVVC